MTKEELLCISANGMKVVFNPINSHTETHFKDSLKLRELVKELLSDLNLEGNIIAKDFDMGKTAGNSEVVVIDGTDELVFAMRKSREDQGFVPFTKSRSSKPSRLISIYLVRKDDHTYELSSAWIGEFESPPFPRMKNATADSIPYWNKHAFVWGSQEIIPGTEISNRPW